MLSGAGESHPRALPEPCVSVATHTAPITQLFTVPLVFANGRTTPAVSEQWRGASELLGAANDIACISSGPTGQAADLNSRIPGQVPTCNISHSS